ncbi:MAG: hypothetical protein KBI41_11745, partial [Kiritimatiellae bacterium]|nr:hypothetical protein [Kiritimatiellia bacterium]
GSATSKLFNERLDKGHCKTLKPDDLARLALWVDLGVPFCADYTEAAAWSPEEWEKHRRAMAKREAADAVDRATLHALAKERDN